MLSELSKQVTIAQIIWLSLCLLLLWVKHQSGAEGNLHCWTENLQSAFNHTVWCVSHLVLFCVCILRPSACW